MQWMMVGLLLASDVPASDVLKSYLTGTPQQRAELPLERLVRTRLRPGGAELVQGRDQRLRNESTPVGAEPLLDRSGAHRLAPRDDMRGCSERSEE